MYRDAGICWHIYAYLQQTVVLFCFYFVYIYLGGETCYGWRVVALWITRRKALLAKWIGRESGWPETE